MYEETFFFNTDNKNRSIKIDYEPNTKYSYPKHPTHETLQKSHPLNSNKRLGKFQSYLAYKLQNTVLLPKDKIQ